MKLSVRKPSASREPPEFTEYTQLFERYQSELIRYLYGLVGEAETARDLTQETFLRGYNLWLEDSARVGWRPLLYKIATNCALDLLRRHSKIRFTSITAASNTEADFTENSYSQVEDFSLPDLATQLELRMSIIKTLRRLDLEAATCLLLHYDQGFSCIEIAAMTDTNPTAIWQRLSRARRLFCELYRKEQASDD
jgi:RNA polymerase sigma-70 factor (ECF subfamily)